MGDGGWYPWQIFTLFGIEIFFILQWSNAVVVLSLKCVSIAHAY